MAANRNINLELLKQNVLQKFAELRAALHMREKLLLRQIDVIAATSQQQLGRGKSSTSVAGENPTNSSSATNSEEKEIKFLSEQEEELLASIRSYGRFQLDNMNLVLQDVYLKNEDYITPANDHETMYKCLAAQDGCTLEESFLQTEEPDQSETIIVDFSKNKSLIEHNTKNMNESIINITLLEAKELIRKAKAKREMPVPPLNLEELDDELESSIAEAVSGLGRESPANTKSSQTCVELKKTKKNRFKPKITINNCNGTINLRNISSLTINCATEDAVSAEIPLQYETAEMSGDEALADKSVKVNAQTCKVSSTANLKSAAATNIQNNSASITVAESCSSTSNTTPSTTASSSNYSSNASSRSQSKKQKSSKKIANKNIVSSSSSTLTSASTSQAPCTTTTTTQQQPYEIINDDDDVCVETNDVTCDFYNRLLNEIKNSLKEKSRRIATIDNAHYLMSSNSTAAAQTAAADSTSRDANSNSTCSTNAARHASDERRTCTSSNSNTQTSSLPQGKRLILKNFENLKIILEANSGDEESFHPVQIEQWLAEIISETDLEPMQNTDILEHSKIHNESI